jgi:hypothetical protein
MAASIDRPREILPREYAAECWSLQASVSTLIRGGDGPENDVAPAGAQPSGACG